MPLVAPHGGKLVNRVLDAAARTKAEAEAAKLASITLSVRERFDLEMIAIGAFSPLTGFQGSKDFASVCKSMRLADGTVWPIPVITRLPSSTSGMRAGAGAVMLTSVCRIASPPAQNYLERC